MMAQEKREEKKVFVVRYINSHNKQEMRAEHPTVQSVIDEMIQTLDSLKNRPEGARIEITLERE